MIIDPTLRPALDAFHTVLVSRYGEHLYSIYLFGSRARGDYHAESDADIAVFVDAEGRTRSELLRDQVELSGAAYDIWLDTGIRIQPWVFASQTLDDPERDHNAHLLRNILSEGIAA